MKNSRTRQNLRGLCIQADELEKEHKYIDYLVNIYFYCISMMFEVYFYTSNVAVKDSSSEVVADKVAREHVASEVACD